MSEYLIVYSKLHVVAFPRVSLRALFAGIATHPEGLTFCMWKYRRSGGMLAS